MNKHRFIFILPLIAALALLAAFALTAPVYAQDEAPAEPVPEEAPAETPFEVPADPAGTEEAPPTEELAPVLEEAAETGVTLVDESGEPLALPSEEAAEVLTGGDPWYKVGTTTYHFMKVGFCGALPNCQKSATPINLALDYIVSTTGLPSDGYIHVEADNYTDYIQRDAASEPVLSGFKGFIGETDPVTHEPLVNLAAVIRMYNCTKGFTVTGFNITYNTSYAGITLDGCTGPVKIEDVVINNPVNGMGISITNHNGSVTINRAKVDGNADGGALIDNRLGTAGVTITNSSFNNNVSDVTVHAGGLAIATRGSVNLTGVTAYGNTGGEPGLFIQQSGALSIKNSVFSNNAGYGINNTYAWLGTIPTASITLSNVVMENNTNGNQFFTKGAVSFTGVTANNNGARTFIETCNQIAGVCDWAGSGTVTIKNSFFDGNAGNSYGLYVVARGAITLTNVSASNTTDAVSAPGGAYLDNGYSQLAVPVKVTTGWFDGNEYHGLTIYSKGVVTLSKISASYNTGSGYGVFVLNSLGTTPGVNISGTSTAYNQFNHNGVDGLYIYSDGAISVKYSNFLGNLDDGATLYNNHPGSTGGISIANSNFIENGDDNIYVYSYGPIKLSTIEANQSPTGNGAVLVNTGGSPSVSVTISNANFWDNFLTGLHVESNGNIILTNTAAWDNNGAGGNDGAYLNNATGTGYIKVTNPKSTDLDMYAGFNNNHDRGLNMFTNGTVTLTNVNMIGNWEQGMYAGLGVYPAAVTMTNCRVDDNLDAGILISTIGPVVISGGHANNNLGYGLRINNSYADDALPKPVTIKNFTANGNLAYGVYVTSKGAIALSSVTANDTVGANQAAIWLENNVVGALTPTVTLSKVYANYNIYRGVYVLSNGVVKYLTGEASHNGYTGVGVDTLGAITLSNVRGLDNNNYGAELLNETSITHAPITVTGSTGGNVFSGNSSYGMRVRSLGAISLKNITADDNSGYGIYVNNEGPGTGIGNVTISTITTRSNSMEGVLIYTNGIVALNTVLSMFNNADGVRIITTNDNLYVYNSIFLANRGNGIDASIGTGTFTMSNTLYFGNDTDNTGDLNIYIH